jgi:hypothetical protein
VNYSARGVLHPEASSATVESATGAATTPTAAAMKAATAALDATTQSAGYSALSNAATSEDLELGGSSDAPMHADEGTAKTLTVGTPAHPPAPQHSTPAQNAPAHSSPDSSNESSPPEKTTQSFLSDKNFDFARRMFSMDQDRSNMQVFPSVTMVRISVTDSGAGISKVRAAQQVIVNSFCGNLSNLLCVLHFVICRKIKSACSRKSCSSTRGSCRTAKALASACGVRLHSFIFHDISL